MTGVWSSLKLETWPTHPKSSEVCVEMYLSHWFEVSLSLSLSLKVDCGSVVSHNIVVLDKLVRFF